MVLGPPVNSYPIKTSAKQLTELARDRVGSHNVADPDIEVPLERLFASLNAEAHLSESGVPATEQRILRILSNRLRMLRDCQRHPEIDDQRIVRPLFLTVGGRTGSTKLH